MKRSGTGTEYDPNGQVRYTGKWAENAWNGEGVLGPVRTAT